MTPRLLPPWHGRSAGSPRRAALLLLLATLPLAAAEPPPAPPSGRAAALALLRATHVYDPAIRERALMDLATAPDVVRMDPVVVLESKTELQFTRYMTRKRARDAADRPSVGNGFDVPGVPGLGVRPYHDVMAEDARYKTGTPDVARFALVSLAW